MIEILAANPLLTVFLVVALGAILGAIPFGPLRFGAAGALFVGLALSAMAPELGKNLHLLQGIGLALFVYTVGIAAGNTFFADLKRQMPLMFMAAGVTVVAGVVAIIFTHFSGLPRALSVGIFTGALTAAPALDSATRISGSPDAAVGYAMGYPLGVIIGIVIVSIVVGLKFPARKDTPSLAGTALTAHTVRIKERIAVRHIPGWVAQNIRLSYLARGGRVRVVAPGEDLEEGDKVVVVGSAEAVSDAAAAIGELVEDHLADDRTKVEFERFVISNPEIGGRTVAELNLPAKFGAMVTRVHRGDLHLLARDDLTLLPGDRVSVAVPREELDQVAEYFGNSERRVAEVDALAIGIGMVLGMALGLVSIPLPGGASLALGPAAGPLVVGMILGGLRRSGRLVWTIPHAANLTMRQLGLLFFLAALGLSSGPSFAKLAFSQDGLMAGAMGIAIALVACVGVALGARLLDLSAPRAAGAVAGLLGQPAVLDTANQRLADERIESAYAALFAWDMIIKILLVPLIFFL